MQFCKETMFQQVFIAGWHRSFLCGQSDTMRGMQNFSCQMNFVNVKGSPAMVTFSKSSLNGIYPNSCCSVTLISTGSGGCRRVGDRTSVGNKNFLKRIILHSCINLKSNKYLAMHVTIYDKWIEANSFLCLNIACSWNGKKQLLFVGNLNKQLTERWKNYLEAKSQTQECGLRRWQSHFFCFDFHTTVFTDHNNFNAKWLKWRHTVSYVNYMAHTLISSCVIHYLVLKRFNRSYRWII